MSYQSPNIIKIAKATALPSSPAGEEPNDNDNNNDNSSKAQTTQPSSADFTQSEKRANARMHLCLRFKNVAELYLQSSNFQQCSEGDDPSEEALENAKTQRRQWKKDILEDEGATGLNEVLKASFLRESEAELQRLSGFGRAEATAGARVAWNQVLDLTAECKALKTDVDRAMD